MDADIAERAVRAMCRAEPPEPPTVGLPVAPEIADQPALQIRRLDMTHRPNGAPKHHVPNLLDRRRIAVGEVHHADLAGFLHCLGHLNRQRRIRRKRLFVEDMLAGSNSRHRGRIMHAVWRDIGHCVEFTPGQRILDAAELTWDAVCRAKCGKPFRHNVDAAGQCDTFDGSKVLRVVVGHATRTENEKTHFRFP